MGSICGPSWGICAVRITRVDSLGNVIAGDNAYVSDKQISVAQNANIETGNTFSLRNGCGCGLSRKRAPNIFNWWEFVFTKAELEPEMESFLLGAETIEDGSDVVGIAWPGELACDDNEPAVAFEFWTQHLSGSGQDLTFPWVHHVYPMTVWSLGDGTFEEEYHRPVLNGFSITNEQWGDGPYSDGPPDSQNIAEGGRWFTDVDPPTADCAAVNVTATS